MDRYTCIRPGGGNSVWWRRICFRLMSWSTMAAAAANSCCRCATRSGVPRASAAAVAAAVSKGLQVHCLDLDGLHAGDPLPAKADHVVAFHVLEHLARPGSLFEFAKGVISPSGRLWVAVPSDRRASRVYGEADALDSPPHHLSRWSISALESVGLAHGWAMERHLYEPLPSTLAVWEATRRLPFFHWASSRWRPLERLARRVLAAGVWLSRRHVRANASGFSMLACFRPTVAS